MPSYGAGQHVAGDLRQAFAIHARGQAISADVTSVVVDLRRTEVQALIGLTVSVQAPLEGFFLGRGSGSDLRHNDSAVVVGIAQGY